MKTYHLEQSTGVFMKITYREPKASKINRAHSVVLKDLSLLKLPQPPSDRLKVHAYGTVEMTWDSSAPSFITILRNKLEPGGPKSLRTSDLVQRGIASIEVFAPNGFHCQFPSAQVDALQQSSSSGIQATSIPQPSTVLRHSQQNFDPAQFHPLPNRPTAYPLQMFPLTVLQPNPSPSSSSLLVPPIGQTQPPVAGPYSTQSPSYMSRAQIHPPIKRKRAPEDQGDNSRQGEPPSTSTSTDPVPTPVPSSSEPDPGTPSPPRKDAHKEVQMVQLYQALHSLEAELACEKEARSKAEAELSKVKLAEEEARLRAEDMSRRLEETRAQSERDLENTEMALKDVQRALRESEEARKKSEDALEDLKREIKEPFVVPALLEAFGMVSAMTSAVRDNSMGAE
ncbi:hypothetical protein VKT23_011088 [Stygiomarasmius scandens]|uniref:C2 NT-type domain-containing protein n=1 Tax=Marasmiellus scandens TaxID=2682957 RepID=A0ABR1JAP0_9AGAR